MLFTLLKFLRRLRRFRFRATTDRRLTSPQGRREWEDSRREREALERRLNYLEAQAEVYARKDL